MTRIKKKIADLAWWIIIKLEGKTHVKSMRIDTDKIEIEVDRYLQPDGNWHHLVTTATWLREKGGNKDFAEVAVWVDDELAAKYMLDD